MSAELATAIADWLVAAGYYDLFNPKLHEPVEAATSLVSDVFGELLAELQERRTADEWIASLPDPTPEQLAEVYEAAALTRRREAIGAWVQHRLAHLPEDARTVVDELCRGYVLALDEALAAGESTVTGEAP